MCNCHCHKEGKDTQCRCIKLCSPDCIDPCRWTPPRSQVVEVVMADRPVNEADHTFLRGLEFQECDSCAAKPGSQTLCRGCLHNRELISLLQRIAKNR
jgi:hypothetical protein